MKFAQMICAESGNLGDEIQAIAAARFFTQIDRYVDRECLHSVKGLDPVCTLMSGWFMHGDNWPPCDKIRPIFVGFHVTPEKYDTIARHAEYLKRHEPIGVRDRGTGEFLRSLGINVELTYCITLTLPPRTKSPARGKVVIVDAKGIKIPPALSRHAVRLEHWHKTHRVISAKTKLNYAQDLLDFYRDSASLVITTRLHCALPCIAMGIPVIFFGDPQDSRLMIISDIGGTIYNSNMYSRDFLDRILLRTRRDNVDWSPQPIDVSAVRDLLVQRVTERLEALSANEGTNNPRTVLPYDRWSVTRARSDIGGKIDSRPDYVEQP